MPQLVKPEVLDTGALERVVPGIRAHLEDGLPVVREDVLPVQPRVAPQDKRWTGLCGDLHSRVPLTRLSALTRYPMDTVSVE